MADEDRASDRSVAESLIPRATRSSFFQLVRLLERCFRAAARVGYGGPAAAEVLRFRPDTSLAFPASDISGLEVVPAPGADTERFRVTTTFLGLYGSSSPLPSFYSEEILQTDEEQNRIRDFLDLFHHRLLSLFYRCWSKYRYHVQFEYGEADPLTPRLFSLIGLGTSLSRLETGMPEPLRLLQFAGLIHQQPHSASALESILREYFDGLPVEVEPCTGRWVAIRRGQRSSLGVRNCRLNTDCTIGRSVFARTGSFRIRIGPVACDKFLDFLPDRRNHRILRSLVDYFNTDRFEFDIAFQVIRPPRLRLSSSRTPEQSGARLGWTSWLMTEPSAGDRTGTVLFNRTSFEETGANPD